MSTPLFGLVLAGGQSRRMGRDKALLDYRGMSQLEWSDRLLKPLCAEVFVSSRPGQFASLPYDGCRLLQDRFHDMGPMAGILTAFDAYPDAAWLVLACDLPYLDDATLRALLDGRDPDRDATAFDSAHDGLPEPLCAIYEPRFCTKLETLAAEGIRCPRKALLNADTARLALPAANALDNVNHPEEHDQALRDLTGG